MARILVIPDDDTVHQNLDMVRTYLSVCKWEVRVFRGLEEARIYFEEDGAVCDLVVAMGKTNGSDIARFIRHSQRPRVRVLAICGQGENIDPTLFDSSLIMPFKLRLLGETVASLMAPR